MDKKRFSFLKPFLKPLLVIGLVIALAFSHADGALAARSGGRIGGGSFRAPSRTYSAPRTYAPGGGYGGGYYPRGGGFGFPFLLPFFWGGGFGGIFTILIVIALANFVVSSFRGAGVGSTEELESTGNSTVSVAQVQVGLLAQARELQTELDALAERADTGTAQGRAQVLQEATLALLRHPEYWIYAGTQSEQTRLTSAEARFNQLSLAERSKFSEETLSNYNNELKGAYTRPSLPVDQKGGAISETQDPGEYIVVTVLVGAEGKLALPKVQSTEELRQALRQIGGVSSERLLAVEILWTPQASGDSLSSDDMMAEYPNLKLV